MLQSIRLSPRLLEENALLSYKEIQPFLFSSIQFPPIFHGLIVQ